MSQDRIDKMEQVIIDSLFNEFGNEIPSGDLLRVLVKIMNSILSLPVIEEVTIPSVHYYEEPEEVVVEVVTEEEADNKLEIQANVIDDFI